MSGVVATVATLDPGLLMTGWNASGVGVTVPKSRQAREMSDWYAMLLAPGVANAVPVIGFCR